MIRWLDGFDHTGESQVTWKYNTFGSFKQDDIENGVQPPGSPGGGYAYRIFNTGFGEFAFTATCRISSSTWIVGANIYIDGYSSSSDPLQNYPFWRWESGASNGDASNNHTQLMVGWDNNGNLRFIVGGTGQRGSGSLVYTSAYVIPLLTWIYLEFEVTFGASGRIRMWVNDALQFDQSGLNLQNPSEKVNPDRMSLIWDVLETKGIHIDNWYIADDSGSFNNTQLGPSRISIVFPNLDAISEGFTRNSGTTNTSCVQDPGGPGLGPDGTTTQVTTASAGSLDLYGVTRPACFGKILGLALNIATQGGSGVSSADLVCRPQADPTKQFNVGAGIAVPAAYGDGLSIIQAITEQNPVTSSVWRDGDIAEALWGMRSGAALDVTQLFVEKITSLRVQPYDCGGGSYAYAR